MLRAGSSFSADGKGYVVVERYADERRFSTQLILRLPWSHYQTSDSSPSRVRSSEWLGVLTGPGRNWLMEAKLLLVPFLLFS